MKRRNLLIAVVVAPFVLNVGFAPGAKAITQEEYEKRCNEIWWQSFFGLRSSDWEITMYDFWYNEWQKQVRARVASGTTTAAQVVLATDIRHGDLLEVPFTFVGELSFTASLWGMDIVETAPDKYQSYAHADIGAPIGRIDYYQAQDPWLDSASPIGVSGNYAWDQIREGRFGELTYLGSSSDPTSNFELLITPNWRVESAIYAVAYDASGLPLFDALEASSCTFCTIPEPSSCLLLLSGVVAVGIVRSCLRLK